MQERDESFSLAPINFFQISAVCKFLEETSFPGITAKNAHKYLLPDTSSLCGEEHFADFSMGWNAEGLTFYVSVQEPFSQVFYPEPQRGDSVEVFIDTRDVKSSGYNTRFCHHFFFLPAAVEGVQAGEITRFRTEDVHELCDAKELLVLAQMKRDRYSLSAFIPAGCLHGYDPEQLKRLGFTYRINRSNGSAQHFSVISQEYQLEQQPSLWASLELFIS